MLAQIAAAEREGLARLETAATLDDLKLLETELLGRRSPLSGFKQGLGSLDGDQRREVGQALNAATKALGAALAARRDVLAVAERRALLEAERLDLSETTTLPTRGHRHLVTQARDRLEDVFVSMGFIVADGPEVESDWYNFEALNMPPNHPARSMFDTLFVDYGEPGTTVLRTHTSPVQIRLMQAMKPPIHAVMPGRVFRRDTADATHMPVFHQIEGLVVDRNITLGDLAGTIQEFAEAYFGPGWSSRLRPSYFPFTEPSAEFDIQRPDGTWLELGGCGMVHPNVFRHVGLDPEEWSGFAFGFGIDRFALTRHGVDDLREMFSNDIRFLEQF
ncbi:MAG: phenylalanine--tRNA ligase subunit alpha [Acidimicrobiia bacterium]